MWNLDDPLREPARRILTTPGAFLWWYLDALDDVGDGVVCIWSWGLPFLSGERRARQQGRPARPVGRPSLNLVVYRAHRPVAYTLYRPAQAGWTGGEDGSATWWFDDTRITRDRAGRHTTLHAEIDLPIPGSTARWTGTMTLRGPTAHLADPDDACAADAVHRWAPLTGPATLDVHLQAEGTPLLRRIGLSAYHDRNVSPTPLDELGLRRWTWGRHTFGDRTWVHYLSWPDTRGAPPDLIAAELGADGSVRAHRLAAIGRRQRRAARLGMAWWRRLEVPTPEGPLHILHGPPVDDGPFYLRQPTRASLAGRHAPGWAEWCQPDRIDLDRHRWPVSMVQQHADPTRDSVWSPLFIGPARSRVRRLVSSWMGVGR